MSDHKKWPPMRTHKQIPNNDEKKTKTTTTTTGKTNKAPKKTNKAPKKSKTTKDYASSCSKKDACCAILTKQVEKLEHKINRMRPVIKKMKEIERAKCGPRGPRGPQGPPGPGTPPTRRCNSLLRFAVFGQYFVAPGKSSLFFPDAYRGCADFGVQYVPTTTSNFVSDSDGEFRLNFGVQVEEADDIKYFLGLEVIRDGVAQQQQQSEVITRAGGFTQEWNNIFLQPDDLVNLYIVNQLETTLILERTVVSMQRNIIQAGVNASSTSAQKKIHHHIDHHGGHVSQKNNAIMVHKTVGMRKFM